MAEDRFARFEGGPDPTPTPDPGDSALPVAPDWTQRLPEQYRENPDGYFEHVSDVERRAQEADQWREYGTRAATWIDWAQPQLGQRGGQPQGQIPMREESPGRWVPPPNPLEGADWDDPQTVPQVLQRMHDTYQERDRQRYDEIQLTHQEVQQRAEAFQNLFGYYDRINRLDTQALYQHVNYTPPVSRDRIAEYMQGHPGVSPEDAHARLTEDARMETARRAGYEEGQREAGRAEANTRTTTETTRGTPPARGPVQSNPHRGYGTRPQALYDSIETRRGRREW